MGEKLGFALRLTEENKAEVNEREERNAKDIVQSDDNRYSLYYAKCWNHVVFW
jgi:hypothetical protein